MIETKTFTLGERVKVNSYGDYDHVHYCSYCGDKAKRKDIGSSHNHRWEEDIIFYCGCENAMKEIEIKNKMSEHKNKLFYLERDLKEMEKLENNEIVNTMKYKKELDDLKIKFKIK
jgi:hypothetical protein